MFKKYIKIQVSLWFLPPIHPFVGPATIYTDKSEVEREGVIYEKKTEAKASPADKDLSSSGGPGPGWGPVRVGARSGLGPIWAHRALMGP